MTSEVLIIKFESLLFGEKPDQLSLRGVEIETAVCNLSSKHGYHESESQWIEQGRSAQRSNPGQRFGRRPHKIGQKQNV